MAAMTAIPRDPFAEGPVWIGTLTGSGCDKGGTNALKDDNMAKKEKPETLIQLLASYRRAEFPKDRARPRDLAGVALTIQSNCAVTIQFTDKALMNLNEDGEAFFTLYSLRNEAMILKRKCARLRRRARSKNVREELASLRLQYDNLTGTIEHLFTLLDRGLAVRLDGVL